MTHAIPVVRDAHVAVTLLLGNADSPPAVDPKVKTLAQDLAYGGYPGGRILEADDLELAAQIAETVRALCPKDCDADGVLDECEIFSGASTDCNHNRIPDECEPDLDCNDNGVRDICDVGAETSADCNRDYIPDECQVVAYVDADAVGGDTGASWADAFSTLQQAFDFLSEPEGCSTREIWVAQGTYVPSARSDTQDPRSATFNLPVDTQVYGGFAGFETLLGQRNRGLYPTLLSGDLAHNDVGAHGDPTRGENVYHVVTGGNVQATTVLDGFVIVGGASDDVGGGMLINEGSPTIRNCIFVGNEAALAGGAAAAGGQSSSQTAPVFVNTVFSGNYAGEDGGAVRFTNAEVTFVNCTFATNGTDGQTGGGIAGNSNADNTSMLAVINSILWRNTAGFNGRQIAVLDPEAINPGTCTVAVSYSDVQGGQLGIRMPNPAAYPGNTLVWETNTNLDADPLFTDADGADDVAGTPDDCLRLVGASPCVDAGSNEDVPSDAATDLDGNPRIVDGDGDSSVVVDMGAYESNPLETPLSAPLPHDRLKNRYISFRPNNDGFVALNIRRTSPGPPTQVGWVGVPDGAGFAEVVPSMQFHRRFWSEPVVHVGDCEIMPDATYEVQSTQDGITYSAPLAVPTAARPAPLWWGDVVGYMDPYQNQWTEANGVVNMNDLIAEIHGFQRWADAPHVTVLDLAAVGSASACLNRIVNFTDVFLVIKAFQGEAYPFYVCSANGRPCSSLGAPCPTVPGDQCGVGSCVLPDSASCQYGCAQSCERGACCSPSLHSTDCEENVQRYACVWSGLAYAGNGSTCLECPHRCDHLGVTCDNCWLGTALQGNCPGGYLSDSSCDCGCQWDPLLEAACEPADDFASGQGFAGQEFGGDGPMGPESGEVALSVSVEPYQIQAEQTATIEVFVDSVANLGAYETAVVLTPTTGSTGTLTLEALTIETTRADFAFGAQSVVSGSNLTDGKAGAALVSGSGISVTGPAYLATYTYRASTDAVGVWEVTASDEAYLLDGAAARVECFAGNVEYIRVGVECTLDGHCDDGNQCTSDACVSGTCAHTNLPNGTLCDDGLFCTKTDKCNGSGVCVGGYKTPCTGTDHCCEDFDACFPEEIPCGGW
ncbi:MAG: hypothetical protein HY763_15130 [Planctomycetes bacterium]|nr:hypothetical protein [Planctomycetota bacterium]